MHLPVLTTFLSIIALAAGQSGRNARCFITNDWGSIVPGKPHVLIWDSGSFWDVLLNSGVHSQAEIAGVIARNITQNSIVWIPPKDITKGDPNRVFAVQLWDLAKGTGCVSSAFRFAEGDSDGAEKTASLPVGPVVTTAASLLNFGSITVTAAVATFQSDKAATDQTATGSITGTDTAIPTNSSAPQDNGSSSGPNVLAVAIGTILGLLVVSLIVLSILLWRSRRKRTRQRAESNADTKSITTPTVSRPQSVVRPNSRYTNAAEMTGDSSRFEMEVENIPQELPPEDMAPVELPADEVPPPRYPGEGTVPSVSSLGEVRRSSIDKMFVVSPASDRSSQP